MIINEGMSKHANLQKDIDHTDVILLYPFVHVMYSEGGSLFIVIQAQYTLPGDIRRFHGWRSA